MNRTLVIGIALPHVSFDNQSFVSAPSLAEYRRVVVEPAASSRVVQEVIEGSVDHANFAGQPVVNGPASSKQFALKELLLMRRREALQMLANGGVIVCFAHPDAQHDGIAGLGSWRRYDWLPPPRDASYDQLLLPTFGRTNLLVSEPDHPFALYVQTFSQKVSYHAQVGEGALDQVRVFARSAGGVPLGAQVAVHAGTVVFLPTLLKPEEERALLAETLFQCLERWDNRLNPHAAQGTAMESSSSAPA